MAPKKRDQGFTESDVSKKITNPIYAGIGPYQAIVTDDQWVAAVKKMLRERGAERVLRDILSNPAIVMHIPEGCRWEVDYHWGDMDIVYDTSVFTFAKIGLPGWFYYKCLRLGVYCPVRITHKGETLLNFQMMAK